MPETVAITQARDRAEKAYSAAQDLLKAHASPDAEQLKAINLHMDDFDAAKREMDTLLRVSASEKAFSDPSYKTPRGPGLPEGVSMDTEANAAQMKAAAHNRAFLKALRQVKGMRDNHDPRVRMNDEEHKALSSFSAVDGGLATSEDFQNRLITRMRDPLTIRARATVISTNAATVSFPSFDMGDIESDITLEGEEAGEILLSNVLGKTSLVPNKIARVFWAPEELVEDLEYDLIKLITDQLAIRFNEVNESLFLNGDGAQKPLGVLKAGVGSVDTAAADGISAEDVMGLPYDVRQVYRSNGVYMTHRATLKKIRLLREASGDGALTGQFLWQPSFVAGQPATIAGYPVYESERFPSAWGTTGTDGTPALLFGDWAQYWVVERKAFSLRILAEVRATKGQIGYLCSQRIDGAPVILEAFKLLKRKAAPAS